jgi:hypothetical protein
MLPHDLALAPRPPLSRRPSSRRNLALYPLHPELPQSRGTLVERGVDVSYETIRRWVLKFGARRLRQRRPRPRDYWHLDEMVARIAGSLLPAGCGSELQPKAHLYDQCTDFATASRTSARSSCLRLSISSRASCAAAASSSLVISLSLRIGDLSTATSLWCRYGAHRAACSAALSQFAFAAPIAVASAPDRPSA